MNRWRSRTAEEIFRNTPGCQVKSADTEPGARIRVTAGLLGWADHIFVMESKHRAYLQSKFPDAITEKPIYCLNIPDDFEFMDPDLVVTLQSAFEKSMCK
jgi:predicted protein tyrosine phosphatase